MCGSELIIRSRGNEILKNIQRILPLVFSPVIAKYDYCFEGKIDISIWNNTFLITHIKELSNENIVIVSNDNLIRIWNPYEKQIIELKGHTDYISCILVLPDDQIVSGSDDGSLIYWDSNINFLKSHTFGIISIINLQNNLIASSSLDNTIKIWDYKQHKLIFTLTGHKWKINKIISFQNKLISASNDCTIKIWDIVKGELITTLKGHTRRVNSICLLLNNNLVSISDDETLRVWDLNTYKCIFRSEEIKYPMTDLISLPNNYVITLTYQKEIVLWDLNKNIPIKIKNYSYNYIDCFYDNIIMLSPLGRFYIWNLATDKIKIVKIDKTQIPNCMTILSDGRIATGLYNGKLIILS